MILLLRGLDSSVCKHALRDQNNLQSLSKKRRKFFLLQSTLVLTTLNSLRKLESLINLRIVVLKITRISQKLVINLEEIIQSQRIRSHYMRLLLLLKNDLLFLLNSKSLQAEKPLRNLEIVLFKGQKISVLRIVL